MRQGQWRIGVVAMAVFAANAVQAQQGGFAAPGAKATVTVEYRFEAQGKKQDKYDLHEWQLQRRAELKAELKAKKPQSLPGLHPMEAAQTARREQQQAQAQKAATQMAPMMAQAQAIMDRCGDDEACIERESMKMAAGLSPQQSADAQKTGRETAAVMKPGADRYQIWEGLTQSGSYQIDERWQVVHADPICVRLPRQRCTHELLRKGAGTLAPAKTPAMAEIDTQGGSMVLMLPIPLATFAYVETHNTDEPEGTHSEPTPKGPRNLQLMMRVTPEGKSPAPLRVALKGGWRSQSGEEIIPMSIGPWHGAPGDGRLIVRWRFAAQ